MRVVTIVGVALVCGAATLKAQHAHQFEIGGFGTYTRFDKAFALDNAFGGGGRLGFYITDFLSLEVDGLYQRPDTGGGSIRVLFGSASLVLNFGPERNFYVLGGFSGNDFGKQGRYNFADNAVHAGIGDRFFFSDRAALRFEVRGYYAPSSNFPGTWAGHVSGSAGLSFFVGPSRRREEAPPPPPPEIPKAKPESIVAVAPPPEQPPPQPPAEVQPQPPAQPEPQPPAQPQPPRAPQRRPGPSYEQRGGWAHQWYWGGQAGVFVFQTNFENYTPEPVFGGHWLITGKRTALYVAYEQAFFLSDRHATIVEPDGTINPGNITFRDLRRIMVGVLAFPARKRIEPFGGGGFAIMQVLSPEVSCSSCVTLSQLFQMQDEADNAASKAFFWWMGGIDIKQGRLALYGHYILTSAARGFLISGTTHTFAGGVRISLGSAKEGVTDRH